MKIKMVKILLIPENHTHQESYQNLVGLILSDLNINTGVISLSILNKPEIRDYNQKYRDKDLPTDVISFPSEIEDDWGDILICPEIIKNNAIQFNVDYFQELIRVITHGILHLLGYNHDNLINKRKMFDRQEQIVNNLQGWTL
jgi:probable rRNA maturation factor